MEDYLSCQQSWVVQRIYEQYAVANAVSDSRHLYHAYSKRLRDLMKKLFYSW